MREIKIIQDDGEERLLGILDETNHTLYLKRKKSVHFLRKFGAWGIDTQTFNNLVDYQGLKKIVIHELESSSKYEATVWDFKNHGKCLKFYPHKLQTFLEESYWKKISR